MKLSETQVAIKNCALSIKCITKVDGIITDNAEDLDLVIPTCNLLEYSSIYSDTTGSLRFYSKDKATDFNADIDDNAAFKSLLNKTKLIGEAEAQPISNKNNEILKNALIAGSLKYLSNFWRSLEMPLTNCKVELKLKWTKQCV